MAAKDKEKYFWWKKDKNFYSNHKIRALEKQKNGYAYLIMFEKIMCESTPYNGFLNFSETRAYTLEELSAVVDMPLKTVKSGLEAMKDLELINIHENGTIEIIGFSKLIGCESGQTKRKKEAKENAECGNDVVNFTPTLPQEAVIFTQESRVKSKDIRNIYYYLSSSYDNYIQLLPEKKEKAEKVLMMMEKAYEITNILPSKQTLYEMFIYIMDQDGHIMNEQGYLIDCFRRDGKTK